MARTVPPNAFAISWPPRQWPSTGTSLRTASRTSSSAGAIQGRSSFTLIGPPMKTRPEKRRGSRGTARALVERDELPGELSARSR